MQTKTILFIISLFLIFTSCNNCEKGSGIPTKKNFEINENPYNFEIEFSAEINILQADTNLIEIEADSNFISLIEFEQSSRTVTISTQKCIDFEDNFKITIKCKRINEISIEGNSKLESLNQLKTNKLEINASGASILNLNVNTEKLTINNNGSSNSKIIGNAEKLYINLSGSSIFVGDKLNTKKAYIDNSGSSNCSVRCSRVLEAELSGSSSLKYFGHPSKVNTDVSGSARITAK